MKKKLTTLLFFLVALLIIFYFIKNTNTEKKQKVQLKASELMKSRKIFPLLKKESIKIKDEEARKLLYLNDRLWIATNDGELKALNKDGKAGKNIFDLNKGEIYEANLEKKRVICFYKEQKGNRGIFLYDLLGKKSKILELKEKYFRALLINDSVLCAILDSDNYRSVIIKNINTNKLLHRFDLNKIFKLERASIQLGGNILANSNELFYFSRYASYVLKINLKTLNSSIFQTMDSLLPSKIIEKIDTIQGVLIMKEKIRERDVLMNREAHFINEDEIAFLASTTKNPMLEYALDIYSTHDFYFKKSYLIPNWNTKTRAIDFCFDERKENIWVLYSDNKTVVKYEITQ